jgi:hypothetical protein
MALDYRGCIIPAEVTLPMELVGKTVQFRDGFVIVKGTILELKALGAFNLQLKLDHTEWRIPFGRRWHKSKIVEATVYGFYLIRDEDGKVEDIFDTTFFMGHNLVA